MTSTLERPISPEVAPPDVAVAPDEVPRARRSRGEPTSGRSPAHVVLAVLLGAAGLIHLVVVPTHLDASTADGVAFVTAGWAQLVLAVLVVARPRRWALVLGALASALLVGGWVMAHSVGLPYGAHRGAAETATFVSQVTVALEVAAVVLAIGLAFRPPLGTARHRTGLVLAGLATAGVLALTTAAIASPSVRGHGHGEGAGEAAGHAHGGGADHHGAAATPTGMEKAEDDLGYAVLGNGHEHEVPEGFGEPLDDETEMLQRQQLAHAYELQAQYPTVADAEAAGYRRAGPFAPGLGAHYGLNIDGVGGGGEESSPEGAPEVGSAMLIYDGIEPDAPIAGFMYSARSLTDEPTEGFAGVDDVWHFHTDVCIVVGPGGIDAPLGADRSSTEAECDEFGGFLIDQTGYMVHVWSVPGYESSDGLFSNLNPALRCPDGTYHQAPADEVGTATTTCRAA